MSTTILPIAEHLDVIRHYVQGMANYATTIESSTDADAKRKALWGLYETRTRVHELIEIVEERLEELGIEN